MHLLFKKSLKAVSYFHCFGKFSLARNSRKWEMNEKMLTPQFISSFILYYYFFDLIIPHQIRVILKLKSLQILVISEKVFAHPGDSDVGISWCVLMSVRILWATRAGEGTPRGISPVRYIKRYCHFSYSFKGQKLDFLWYYEKNDWIWGVGTVAFLSVQKLFFIILLHIVT